MRGSVPYVRGLAWRNEVLRLADAAGMGRAQVVVLVLDLWSWLYERRPTGFVPLGSADMLLGLLEGATPAFCRALLEEGWVVESEAGLEVPHFDRDLSRWLTRRAQLLSVSRPGPVSLEQAARNLEAAYA